MKLSHLCLFLLTISATYSAYFNTPTLAMMEAHLADPVWDGQKIPEGQQCSRYGGDGATPKLVINGVPNETDEIAVAFNDESFPLMNNGGHGVIGFAIGNERPVILRPVPGETNDLPKGVRSIDPHRATNPVYSPGTAYLPPCSGAMGNIYSVTISALEHTTGGRAHLLDQIKIPLGRY